MPHYKGIILAGGSGSRLYPITLGVSKQMLPVYDKPLIYYPLSVLMLAGIREILIITTEKDFPHYQHLLGDGSELGIELSFQVQKSPSGIPEAFVLGASFLAGSHCCLILGDNLFYGQYFSDILRKATSLEKGASLLCYHVNNPEDFGVVEFNQKGSVLSLEEKPEVPRSNYAITGIYFCDPNCVEIAKSLKPSLRGETEIIDVLRAYLNEGNLYTQILGRGFAWLDTGTHDSLLKAGQFVQTIEERQGLKIACLEEISIQKGWISTEQLETQYEKFKCSTYGDYLLKLLKEKQKSMFIDV